MKNINTKEKSISLFKFKIIFSYIFLCFALFFILFTFFKFPAETSSGVQVGIDLCLSTLIPSLFPFMVFSDFLIKSGAIEKMSSAFSFISRLFFSLPKESFSVFLLSALGGYPVGPKSALELYKRGVLNLSDAQRTAAFCVNPSPAFVITTLGIFLLGDKRIGVIIYISSLSASFFSGIISRIFKNDSCVYEPISNKEKSKENIFAAFSNSVISAGRSVLIICAFVIFFSSVNRLCDSTIKNERILYYVKCLLEITNGITLASGESSIPFIGFIVSFGGLCTIFQNMESCVKLKLSFFKILSFSFLRGVFTYLIIRLLMLFIPIEKATAVFSEIPKNVENSSSAAVSIFMLLMLFLFILGDSFEFKKKAK